MWLMLSFELNIFVYTALTNFKIGWWFMVMSITVNFMVVKSELT